MKYHSQVALILYTHTYDRCCIHKNFFFIRNKWVCYSNLLRKNFM